MKIKIASESGQTETKLENELEEEVEVASESGRHSIMKNKITATSNFPLSFDKATHQISITTPQGTRVLTTLPDQAVNVLLTKGVLSRLSQTATESARTNEDSAVKIESRDNKLVYRIAGEKTYKIFGVIPVNTPVVGYVSLDSGDLVAETQPVIAKLLSLISTK